MNEIIWDLNTMNDNAASLIAYLRRFSKTFLDQAGLFYAEIAEKLK